MVLKKGRPNNAPFWPFSGHAALWVCVCEGASWVGFKGSQKASHHFWGPHLDMIPMLWWDGALLRVNRGSTNYILLGLVLATHYHQPTKSWAWQSYDQSTVIPAALRNAFQNSLFVQPGSDSSRKLSKPKFYHDQTD